MDEGTKTTVSKIPLLTVRASPRDGDAWTARLKEELTALIKYVQNNKEQDKDWFHIECNPHGTRWSGRCWYFYDQIRYEFDLEFDIPVTYPAAAPELKLPQLDGLTSKMYRGGKICQTLHFQPLWARNVPSMGVAHCLALSVSCNQLQNLTAYAAMYPLLPSLSYTSTSHFSLLSNLILAARPVAGRRNPRPGW
jgi:ufm1-conjugating enzyme 1